MKQSPSWEADRSSASQIFRILKNQKVHYRIHKSPLTVPIWTTPPPPLWRSIFNIILPLRLGLPSGLFPSGLPHQNPVYNFLSPIRATCPTPLLLDLITKIIFHQQYRSWSSSPCSLLHSPVTPSLRPTRHVVFSTPLLPHLLDPLAM